MTNLIHSVIIIGSGPAGYTAALYASRANLKPLLFEGYMSGGQLMTTTDVENFPGYPKGVMGPELMADLKTQALRFGTTCLPKQVTKVNFESSPFKIYCDQEEFLSYTVIISTGATAKYIGLDSEKKLLGKGVSACATCDGAFFKGEKVAVVGGGDSALEEALFLTRFATSVTLIHRRDELRASKIMQDRARANTKINFLWNTEVIECLGTEKLTSLKLKNIPSGKVSLQEFGGLFLAIGHKPATELFKVCLKLDDQGYILTEGKSTRTNIPGIFACGDVQDRTYRQAITAAGSGCSAAIDAERYLEAQSH